MLEILPIEAYKPRDTGILFFGILALYITIARFSYENSRAKLRERGDAVQLVLNEANKTLFAETMSNGQRKVEWEVSESGMWLECNIKDLDLKIVKDPNSEFLRNSES
jgi:hypothetical protein